MKAILLCAIVASASAQASVPVQWKTYRMQRTGVYKASVRVPQFKHSDPVIALANRDLRMKADALMKEFVKMALEIEAKPRVAHEFEVDTTIGVAESGLISLYLSEYSYTGGAHPNSLYTGMTWGRSNGKPSRLTFGNLMRNRMAPAAAAQKLILPKLNELQKARQGNPSTQIPSASVNNFVITRAGITWLFSPYEVGSYAEGPYFVKVPWIDMQGTVAKPSALGPEETEMIDRGVVKLAGKAAYRERIMLPPDSRAFFALVAGSTEVDRKEMSVREAMSGFNLSFSTKKWPAGVAGELEVSFVVGGRTRFVNAKPIRIERWGTESPLDILMAAPSEPALEGPEWLLMEMDGAGLPGGRTRRPSLKLDPKEQRFSAMGGINRIGGGYSISGSKVKFTPGPSTLMAGPEDDMKREAEFVKLLAKVDRFGLKGNRLSLFAGSKQVFLFERGS